MKYIYCILTIGMIMTAILLAGCENLNGSSSSSSGGNPSSSSSSSSYSSVSAENKLTLYGLSETPGDPDKIYFGGGIRIDGSRFISDGTKVKWEIYLGINAYSNIITNQSFNFQPVGSGKYAFKLITTGGTIEVLADGYLEVTNTNSPPVSKVACNNDYPFAGDTIRFSGSGSFDSDKNPLTYFWSVEMPDENKTIQTVSSQANLDFTPSKEGLYYVKLFADDGDRDKHRNNQSATNLYKVYARPTGAVLGPNVSELTFKSNGSGYQVLFTPDDYTWYQIIRNDENTNRYIDVGIVDSSGNSVFYRFYSDNTNAVNASNIINNVYYDIPPGSLPRPLVLGDISAETVSSVKYWSSMITYDDKYNNFHNPLICYYNTNFNYK